MAKRILTCYCLLTSACINATLDNTIYDSINTTKEKNKWTFMFVPKSFVINHREDIYYMAMIDKTITLSESIKQQIITTLTTLSPNDTIEEAPDIRNNPNFTSCLMGDLLAVNADMFLRSFNLYLENSFYTYAFVAILTLNEANKEVKFKIKKIELESVVYAKDLLINGSSNRQDILQPLLVSCKDLIHAPENSYQINNSTCAESPDMRHLLFDNASNSNDTLFPELSLNGSCYNHADIEPENNFAPDSLEGDKPDNTKSVFLTHMPTHSIDRPYKCESNGCNKEFKLTAHVNIDTKTHVFPCSQCHSIYACKSSLKTHVVKMHTCENPYKCKLCSYRAASKYLLGIHKLDHTGKKKYKCKWKGCNMAFIQKVNLETHINTHTHNNTFPCQTCGRIFHHKGNLKRHTPTHSSEKKYKCEWEWCNSEFRQQRSLKKHIVLIHEKGKKEKRKKGSKP